jgi:hypothetical protein
VSTQTAAESDVNGLDPGQAIETYRHLRMLLIALPVFLLITTVIGGIRLGDFADSISANYAGPLRDIFVGALVAIGACLIVYRGRLTEDLALNVAGFYAMFVAFVPYSLTEVLNGKSELKDEELTVAKAAAAELVKVLPVIVWSLLAVAIVFLGVEVWRGHFKRHIKGSSTFHKVLLGITLLLGLGFLVLLMVGMCTGKYAGVHMTAAIFMIVGLATAIATHAWGPLAGTRGFKWQYRVLVGMMGAVGLALCWELAKLIGWKFLTGWPSENAVAYIEWVAIFLFTYYWVAETVRQEILIRRRRVRS